MADFRVGREGFFWYDFFVRCTNPECPYQPDKKSGRWIPKEQAQHGPNGKAVCPYCGYPVRTRPRNTKATSRYRKTHCIRIEA